MTVAEEKWVSWTGEVAKEVTESQGSGVGAGKKDTIQKAELGWTEASEKPRMISGRESTDVSCCSNVYDKQITVENNKTPGNALCCNIDGSVWGGSDSC